MIGIILTTITAIAVTVAKSVTLVGVALKTFGDALVGIAKSLGLIKSEENVEDLGDKAIQAEEEGIKPEKFDTYAEYVKRVENFDVNSEKSKDISEDEKALKGIELATGVTVEHFGEKFPVEEFFKFAAKNPEYFREDRMLEFGKIMENDTEKAKDTFDYMKGSEMNDVKISDVMNMLKDIEKKINPEITDREALYTALDARKKED